MHSQLEEIRREELIVEIMKLNYKKETGELYELFRKEHDLRVSKSKIIAYREAERERHGYYMNIYGELKGSFEHFIENKWVDNSPDSIFGVKGFKQAVIERRKQIRKENALPDFVVLI